MHAATLIRTPATAAWIFLVLATLVAWWLGAGHGPRVAASVGMIALAFIKVYVVGHYFMELRSAPVILRLLFGAWVVLVGAGLIGLYLSTG